MKTSTELLAEKQAAMPDEELIAFAEKQVSELARTRGRSHRMCVPPMITDTDMLLSELIRRFEAICSKEDVTNEDLREPIENALYATNRFNTGDCTELAKGILEYIKDAGFKIVRDSNIPSSKEEAEKEECLHPDKTTRFGIRQCADCGKPINN